MKRTVLTLFACLGFVAATAVRAQDKSADPKAAPKPAVTNEVAVLKFKDFGDITVEFLPEVAPKTVENFKKLARDKFYDGTKSHRLIPGFMIQLGDPLTKNDAMEARWGQGDPGYKIKAEFNATKHGKGILSMARGGDPDSAGCQFFICFGPADQLDGKYTVFAKLVKGDEVLTKLEQVPVVPNPLHPRREVSKPTKPVILESVTLTPVPAAAKPAVK